MVRRGLEQQEEQDPSLLIRDTRTLGQRFFDFLRDPVHSSIVVITLGFAAFTYPAVADLAFILGVALFSFTKTRKTHLPFRVPMSANIIDHNDVPPGQVDGVPSRGIYFFGNAKKNNQELWFNNNDMRTHVLIFGSTGSGKTEALIGMAYNALLQGSGFIYVDGKGDNNLFSKVFSMARFMGREDDVLVVNYMTGAKDIIGAQERRLSNTLNPFSIGSSSMLAQLVVSMMDSSSATPDGDMWKGRAIAFVEALMKLLVAMRDSDVVLLDAHSIRQYFVLERIEMIVVDRKFWRQGEEPFDLSVIPKVVLEPLDNYLDQLPGYDKNKKGKQSSQTLEQHGFITMQLTRVFTSLADTYGHIMRHKLAEVDFKDIVLNRRILCVLLPALEKSPDELSNLGKVIVSSLRAMMASGLGESVEGEYAKIIESKPTNAPTPYLCILDEYGYYAVEGFAVVPAQARSLGFSVVFAGQDLPAFQKASKEEAMSIGANTNIKICMKLEDPLETWDFFMKTAGEAFVTKVDYFQTKEDSFTNQYLDTKSSSVEKRQRIDLLDLKDQREGEGHMFFKSQVVRFDTFYADPKPCKVMRLNQMIKLESPPSRELLDYEKAIKGFERRLQQFTADLPSNLDDAAEIDLVAEVLAREEGKNPIEQGVEALLAFHNRHAAPAVPEERPETLPESELNIFTPLRLTPWLEEHLICDDRKAFSEPMLASAAVQQDIDAVERLSGKSAQVSTQTAEELIKDMREASFYPPTVGRQLSTKEVVALANELAELVNKKKAEHSA